MSAAEYVHGYEARESERLVDQAKVLAKLLHSDTNYPAGARVLEVGCGVGAQTVTLTRKSPDARFTAVDISEESLAAARDHVVSRGMMNVEFAKSDIFDLAFAEASFDHVFVCFVLEHLARPNEALMHLKTVLKPGGTVTVIEGDHGSAYFHPDSLAARRAIRCLIELQARSGGDSLIGRRLYPLLSDAGYRDVTVSPRVVYADASRPEMVEGFTRNTFAAMIEGVREEALQAELIDERTWAKGIADLYRAAEDDGTFSYTFFKAVASK